METVYVQSGTHFAIRDLRALLAQRWKVEDTASGGWAVCGGDSRIYIENEIDPDRPDYYQLLLNYSDEELVKEVLKTIADDPSVTVDNDFGVRLSGDQFVARLKAEPTWQWKR